MKANELRIGNWVSNGEIEFQITSKDIYHLDVYVGRVIANPIPITPEWLQRFGFEKINHRIEGVIYKKEWLKLTESCAGVDWRGGHIQRERCKYVHQLQNLYFALTGEELEYKPNI